MKSPTQLADIDWAHWTPVERATLLFVIRPGRVLLIHKKRGLGAGKINGPGGRLEPGENARTAALREVEEELHVAPTGVRQCGVLRFQFADGHSIHCTVFTATGCRGTPTETPEAAPLWVALDRIPFDRMWADDRVWFPLMLAGQRFEGRFLFVGDRLLEHAVSAVARPSRRRLAACRGGAKTVPCRRMQAGGAQRL